jgi:hypothetical protein
MKPILKIAVLGPVLALMLLADVPPPLPSPGLRLVPEAHAILGVRRRTARRTAVVVGSATAASAATETAAAKQQAPAQQQGAAPQPQAAAAAPPPPAPPATGAALPLGTVVPALPPGCVSTPSGGVEYYYCGGNFYRAVFQGNQLVYVTARP